MPNFVQGQLVEGVVTNITDYGALRGAQSPAIEGLYPRLGDVLENGYSGKIPSTTP